MRRSGKGSRTCVSAALSMNLARKRWESPPHPSPLPRGRGATAFLFLFFVANGSNCVLLPSGRMTG